MTKLENLQGYYFWQKHYLEEKSHYQKKIGYRGDNFYRKLRRVIPRGNAYIRLAIIQDNYDIQMEKISHEN